MRRWWIAATLALATVGVPACKSMTAKMTVDVARDASRALEQESDYEFAEAAAPGNLKFLEGLLQVIPNHKVLLEMLTEGFAKYAFAFVEERAAEARARGDEERYERLVERAVGLYERAGAYGLRRLGLIRGWDAAWAKGGAALRQKLSELGPEHAGALFWTAYSFGGAINLGQSPEQLALLPKVVMLMRRVLEIDETFYHGGPHLFFGAYYMALPRALGGNPEKSREHFEKGVAISGGKALLAKVLFARMYAKRVGDKALHDRLLREVQEAPADLLPAQRLANLVAKRKAARLAKAAKEEK